MPVYYDLRKDIRFKEGFEEGLRRKELEYCRACSIRLLKTGMLTVAEIAEAFDMPLVFVVKIQKALEKNPDLK